MTDPLLEAAFGPEPGRWPLPAADTPDRLWLRAVAAGGQGRYAAARADLAELRRGRPGAALLSLALSTRASFERQLGWHAMARGFDGTALAPCAGAESVVDALVGLAADALGLGRLAASAALLRRAARAHRDAADPPPRLAIRLAWVHAELAMAAGDGTAAIGHARRGAELAARRAPGFARHRVKSEVVLAAALCTAGDHAAARAVADVALEQTVAMDLVPLRWALACLLGEIGSGVHSAAAVSGIREQAAEFVTRHGGRLRLR